MSCIVFAAVVQLPEGGTLMPQKIAEIEGWNGVRVFGFQPSRGLLVHEKDFDALKEKAKAELNGKLEAVPREAVPEFTRRRRSPRSRWRGVWPRPFGFCYNTQIWRQS